MDSWRSDTPAAPIAHEHEHYTPISGPSLLGLSGSDEDNDTSSYLLEDEPHHSHTGWFIFSAVAIIVLSVIGFYEWQAIKTGKVNIPYLSSTTAEAPKPADQPVAASTPPANGQTNPQSDHSEDNVSATAPSSDPNAQDTTGANSSSNPDTAAKPSSPADDLKSTQADESRASQEADQRRQTEATKDTETSDDSAASASSDEEAKPDASAKATKPAKPESTSRRAATAEAKPDPRQNKMLIAGENSLYGRGAAQNCSQALMYFQIAARDYNNAPAMSHLGAMYAAGQCVKQDRQAAYKWFVRAQEADPSNQWISRNMNMVWRDMTPQERAAISR